MPDPDVPALKWGVRACLAKHGHRRGRTGASWGGGGGLPVRE